MKFDIKSNDAARPAESLLDVLSAQADEFPTRRAFRFLSDDGKTEQSLTYGELQGQAQRIGSVLERHAQPGARVMLLCPPGLDFITAFLGCLAAGMVATPASAPHPRRLVRDWPRLKSILCDSGAAVIVTSPELSGPLAVACRNDPALPAVSILTWDDFRSSRNLDRPVLSIPRDRLALLQYTSGSTGSPRGVMISHGNLLCNLQWIHQAFGTSESSVAVSWLPFHHDMGLIGGILQPLYCGFPCTFFSPLAFIHRPLRWLQLISEMRATISGGPNFAYDECVRRIPPEMRRTLDLSSWDVAFCGAEPIHAETLDRFAEAFAGSGFRRTAFLPCYGLAESTLLVTGGIPGRSLTVHKMNSEDLAEPSRVGCGSARAGQRVWIVSPETLHPCPEGEVGEIWVSGDSVGQGYWGLPEESRRTFRAVTADGEGPFLRTGDLGYLWSGELFVTGRLKDLVIINGRNHYPQDLERTVNGCHPLLRENACAAFSVEQDQQEQLVIVAEVEPRLWARESAQSSAAVAKLAEAATAAIRRAIADQHEVVPSIILLVSAQEIPRTTSGKLRRRECRTRFLSGQLRGVQSDGDHNGESVVR